MAANVRILTMIAALLVLCALMTLCVREAFEDATTAPQKIDIADLPEPRQIFKGLRTLLDKYDTPDIWNHAAQVMDKDPGQLARMNLGIEN